MANYKRVCISVTPDINKKWLELAELKGFNKSTLITYLINKELDSVEERGKDNEN